MFSTWLKRQQDWDWALKIEWDAVLLLLAFVICYSFRDKGGKWDGIIFAFTGLVREGMENGWRITWKGVDFIVSVEKMFRNIFRYN